MIRIIERKPLMGFKVTCPKCKSVFAFTKDEYTSSYDRSSEIRIIKCPVCGEEIYSCMVPWEEVEMRYD